MADWHDIDKCRVIFIFRLVAIDSSKSASCPIMADHSATLPVGIHAIEDIGDFQAVLLPFCRMTLVWLSPCMSVSTLLDGKQLVMVCHGRNQIMTLIHWIDARNDSRVCFVEAYEFVFCCLP